MNDNFINQNHYRNNKNNNSRINDNNENIHWWNMKYGIWILSLYFNCSDFVAFLYFLRGTVTMRSVSLINIRIEKKKYEKKNWKFRDYKKCWRSFAVYLKWKEIFVYVWYVCAYIFIGESVCAYMFMDGFGLNTTYDEYMREGPIWPSLEISKGFLFSYLIRFVAGLFYEYLFTYITINPVALWTRSRSHILIIRAIKHGILFLLLYHHLYRI